MLVMFQKKYVTSATQKSRGDMKSFSWKTTILGWVISGAYLFLTAISTGVKPKDAAIAVGIGLLGTLAKDHDVTGGKR